MDYSEAQAQIPRDDLSGVTGITEKQMFGGLCFLLNGNMICGVHKDWGHGRAGKDHQRLF